MWKLLTLQGCSHCILLIQELSSTQSISRMAPGPQEGFFPWNDLEQVIPVNAGVTVTEWVRLGATTVGRVLAPPCSSWVLIPRKLLAG